MILPGQFYPLYLGPCLEVSHYPGAVPSQFDGTYPPDQKDSHLNIGGMPWPKPGEVFHEHLLFPYAQGHMGHTEDYATHSGSPTNIEPRFPAFNLYDVPCGDWSHLDDSHRVQEMHHLYPKAPAGGSPAHQAVDLHGIPSLSPIESSIDRFPSPLQYSGHLEPFQVFPTDSQGSSPENPGFVWGRSSYFLSSAPEQEASSIAQGT
jgi:hypothetical protein